VCTDYPSLPEFPDAVQWSCLYTVCTVCYGALELPSAPNVKLHRKMLARTWPYGTENDNGQGTRIQDA
jgi:hypothetical protein